MRRRKMTYLLLNTLPFNSYIFLFLHLFTFPFFHPFTFSPSHLFTSSPFHPFIFPYSTTINSMSTMPFGATRVLIVRLLLPVFGINGL